MGRRLLRSSLGFLLLLALATLSVPASAASGVTLRMVVYKPVQDVAPDWSVPQTANTFGSRWAPLACDGSDVVSNVGALRVLGFATNTTTAAKTQRIRFTYGTNVGPEKWYQYVFPKLPAGVEVPIVDSIQDLTSAATSVSFDIGVPGDAGSAKTCSITTTNVPASSPGFISHRTTPSDTVDSLGIALFRYGDNAPIACGGNDTTTRIKAVLYASNDVAGLYDFHVHVEVGGTDGTGPDQDGNSADRRWWELGLDRTPLPMDSGIPAPGSIGSLVTNTGTGSRVTVHLAQQTGPGQPKNETFCSFTRG